MEVSRKYVTERVYETLKFAIARNKPIQVYRANKRSMIHLQIDEDILCSTKSIKTDYIETSPEKIPMEKICKLCTLQRYVIDYQVGYVAMNDFLEEVKQSDDYLIYRTWIIAKKNELWVTNNRKLYLSTVNPHEMYFDSNFRARVRSQGSRPCIRCGQLSNVYPMYTNPDYLILCDRCWMLEIDLFPQNTTGKCKTCGIASEYKCITHEVFMCEKHIHLCPLFENIIKTSYIRTVDNDIKQEINYNFKERRKEILVDE